MTGLSLNSASFYVILGNHRLKLYSPPRYSADCFRNTRCSLLLVLDGFIIFVTVTVGKAVRSGEAGQPPYKSKVKVGQ